MLNELYNEQTIKDRISDIASNISRDYKDEKLVHVIIAMNGAFTFGADLIRQIKDIPLIVHFAGAPSYFGIEKSQENKSVGEDALPKSFGNNPVLIIEDIVDSGETITLLRTAIASRFSGSIKVATLLKRQGATAQLDYCGFTVPRAMFVVGYGLDIDGRYRELPGLQVYGATMSVDSETGVC